MVLDRAAVVPTALLLLFVLPACAAEDPASRRRVDLSEEGAKGVVVQEGITEGGHFWQLQYGLENGEHCLHFSIDGARMDTSCGFDIPGTTEIGFSSLLKVGQGNYFIFGVTTSQMRTIRAESTPDSSAESTEAPTIPIPKSDLRSFVIVRPPVDDVARLVGLDIERVAVQRIEFYFPPDDSERG